MSIPIDQGVVAWSGFLGAPGYSVFYAEPGQAVMARIREFFEGIKSVIPAGITLTFPSSGKTIDAATGDQIGSWTGSAQQSVVGAASGVFSAASGAVVHWHTATLWRGRLIRGRTFLVPLSGLAYDVNGTLEPGALTLIQTVANGLVNTTSGHMVIWARPNPLTTRPEKGGFKGSVISASVVDKVAVLKSCLLYTSPSPRD